MKKEGIFRSEMKATVSSSVIVFGVIQWGQLSGVLFVSDEGSGHSFVSKIRLRKDEEQNLNVLISP